MVYRAHDRALDRAVALKFLPPSLSSDEAAKNRFIHEAKAASGLNHPNIATVYEIGETEDHQLFIAMGYYPGETLKEKIEKGPMAPDEAIDIAVQLVSGLKKAHEHGVIHRDIKPGNIMITARRHGRSARFRPGQAVPRIRLHPGRPDDGHHRLYVSRAGPG